MRCTVLSGTLGQNSYNILKVFQDVKIVEKMFHRNIIFVKTSLFFVNYKQLPGFVQKNNETA